MQDDTILESKPLQSDAVSSPRNSISTDFDPSLLAKAPQLQPNLLPAKYLALRKL